MSGCGGQDPKISRSLGGFFFDMDGTGTECNHPKSLI